MRFFKKDGRAALRQVIVVLFDHELVKAIVFNIFKEKGDVKKRDLTRNMKILVEKRGTESLISALGKASDEDSKKVEELFKKLYPKWGQEKEKKFKSK
jgi:hypothetical protein